jgi:methionyl-tRNA formyltransferase
MENGKWKMENVGEILSANVDELVVSCGNDSALIIQELQLEGKRRMSARDFLNGVKIRVGEILG